MGMKRALRWIALGLVALLLLAIAAWWLLDAWLTGAGGRNAVERALSERLGMPVRLRGDFAVTLYPQIGVGGSDLAVGADGEALSGREYGLSLALRPLLHKRLVIDSVHLDGGALDLARWTAAGQSPAAPSADAGSAESGGDMALPEIRALTIHEFDWLAEGERQFRIDTFRLDDFAADRESPFELEIDGLASLQGGLRWQPSAGLVAVMATARGEWPGALQGRLEASLPERQGSLDAQWWAAGTAQPPADLRLAVRWALEDSGLRLADIELNALGQEVHGDGCLLTADRTALHLDLSAQRLDLDPLMELPLPKPAGEGAGEGEWPLELHLRLRAGELITGDVTAQGASLQVGGDPACPQPEAVDSR